MSGCSKSPIILRSRTLSCSLIPSKELHLSRSVSALRVALKLQLPYYCTSVRTTLTKSIVVDVTPRLRLPILNFRTGLTNSVPVQTDVCTVAVAVIRIVLNDQKALRCAKPATSVATSQSCVALQRTAMLHGKRKTTDAARSPILAKVVIGPRLLYRFRNLFKTRCPSVSLT